MPVTPYALRPTLEQLRALLPHRALDELTARHWTLRVTGPAAARLAPYLGDRDEPAPIHLEWVALLVATRIEQHAFVNPDGALVGALAEETERVAARIVSGRFAAVTGGE